MEASEINQRNPEKIAKQANLWLGAQILLRDIDKESELQQLLMGRGELISGKREIPELKVNLDFVGENSSIDLNDAEKKKFFEEEATKLARMAGEVVFSKKGEEDKWIEGEEMSDFEKLLDEKDEALVRLKDGIAERSAAQASAFFRTPGNEITDRDLRRALNFIAQNNDRLDGITNSRIELGRAFDLDLYDTDADYRRQVDALNAHLADQERDIYDQMRENQRQFIATTEIEQLFANKLSGKFYAEDFGLPPEFSQGGTEAINLRLRALFNSEEPSLRLISSFLLMKAYRQAKGEVGAGYVTPYIEQTDEINRRRVEAGETEVVNSDVLWEIYFRSCMGMLALGCDDDSAVWLENIKKMFGPNEVKDRMAKLMMKEAIASPELQLSKDIGDLLLNNPYTVFLMKHYQNLGLEPPDPNNPNARPRLVDDISDPDYLARKRAAGEYNEFVTKEGTDPTNLIKNYVVPMFRSGRSIKTTVVNEVRYPNTSVLQLSPVEIRPSTYADLGLRDPAVDPTASEVLKGVSEENAYLALHRNESDGSRSFWKMVSLQWNNGIPWFETDNNGALVLKDEFLCWPESDPNWSNTRFDAFIRAVKKYDPLSPEELLRTEPGMVSSRYAAQTIREFNRDLLIFEPMGVEILLAAFGFQPLSISGKFNPGPAATNQERLLREKINRDGVKSLIYPPIPKTDVIPRTDRGYSVRPSQVILDELTPYDPINWQKKAVKTAAIWGGVWEMVSKKTPGSFQEGAAALRKVVQDEARNVANDELSLFQIEVAVTRAWALLGWLMSINSIPFNPNKPTDRKNVVNAVKDAQNTIHIFLGDYDGLSTDEVIKIEGELIKVQSKAAQNAKDQGNLKQDKIVDPITGGINLVSTIAKAK